MTGYAFDDRSGHQTGPRRHPRTLLLRAIAGMMRAATKPALFTVPFGTGLRGPANTSRAVRMGGIVCARTSFVHVNVAASSPPALLAVSASLRTLILTGRE